MASSPAQRKFHASLSLERRPRLLKDFLNDDYHHSPAASQLLIRSRSKAASATISGALHKVINIVKFFPFASAVKSPSVFISRKLSKRTAASGKNLGHENLQERPAAMVKVKDILRWRSSRDLAAEKSTPLLDDEFCYSPNRCTTATTTTGSKRSSWCDSDFTAEDLPLWCGEIDEHAGVGTMKCGNNNNKNRFLADESVGGYFMDDKQMDPQFDENDQHSPVSVLQSPFREDEDFSFHRSLATIESRKCMLMQRIQQLETLAGGVGGTTTRPENGADEEEEGIQLGANDKAKQMMIHLTTEDIISCSEESYEWEVEEKREAYIRDMEKAAGMRWYNFEEEKEELCREVEVEVFRDLVNEVLAEMFMHKLHSTN
nr:myb-like protein X [Ipomoea batatas]